MSWWLLNSGKLRYDDPVVTTANGGLGQLRFPQSFDASLAFEVWFSMTLKSFKSSNQITRLIFYGLIIV